MDISQAPEAAEPWQGILYATEYGYPCPQISTITNKYAGNEDCLTLNVFTPSEQLSISERNRGKCGSNLIPVCYLSDLTALKQLPVIFYIHGGAFLDGEARTVEPEILLDEDVILVTIQYRLGPYGFLTLGTPEYSGNMGLKDQLLALRWVRANIHSFGGDKDSITIFGHSAGGSSVHFHLLTPQSRGLFKRAIAVGGSAYTVFAYRPSVSDQTDLVKNHLSEILGKKQEDVDEEDIQTWILNSNSEEVINGFNDFFFYQPGLKSKRVDLIWTPVIESELKIIQLFIY